MMFSATPHTVCRGLTSRVGGEVFCPCRLMFFEGPGIDDASVGRVQIVKVGRGLGEGCGAYGCDARIRDWAQWKSGVRVGVEGRGGFEVRGRGRSALSRGIVHRGVHLERYVR